MKKLLIVIGAVVLIMAGFADASRRRVVSPTPAGPLTESNGLAWGSSVVTTVDSLYRYMTTNGIPNHTVGAFPNPGNPNSIRPQNYAFRMPLHPVLSGTVTPVKIGIVALNGVPFDPGTAEFWRNDRTSGWNYEALTGGINLGVDANNAHVQPTGAYHYHGMPEGLLRVLNKGTAVTQVGWASDGFPVYARYGLSDPFDRSSAATVLRGSYRVRLGTRPNGPGGTFDGTFAADWEFVAGSGDLDDCNGRIGVNPDGSVTYQYFITDTYPFIPRCVKGTPDASFPTR